MLVPESFRDLNQKKTFPADFWFRLLREEDLRHCDDLQKLLVGCEIIAALDGADLLAA